VDLASRLFLYQAGMVGYAAVCTDLAVEHGDNTPLLGDNTPLLEINMCARLHLTASFNASVRPHIDRGDSGLALIGMLKRGACCAACSPARLPAYLPALSHRCC
jgi:hypothetical protein